MVKFFKDYVKTKEAKFTIIVTVFAAVFSNLLTSLSSNIIIPLIDNDCNGDNKNDIKQNIKNSKTKVGKKVVDTGLFLYSLIQFIFIILVLIIFSKLL